MLWESLTGKCSGLNTGEVANRPVKPEVQELSIKRCVVRTKKNLKERGGLIPFLIGHTNTP